jgi:tryptophan-rich sensory protein
MQFLGVMQLGKYIASCVRIFKFITYQKTDFLVIESLLGLVWAILLYSVSLSGIIIRFIQL